MPLNEEESLDWFQRMAKTRLYRLAHLSLIRNKKVKPDAAGFYNIHPFLVIIEGLRIVTVANKKGLNYLFKKLIQD